MKRFLLTVLVVASPTLFAAEAGSAYSGIKVGMMFGTDGIDSGSVTGIKVGYNFTSRFSGELEFSTGSLDFGKDFFDAGGQFAGSIFSGVDVDTRAIYGTYRSSGDFFFKAKLGVSDVSVSRCEACQTRVFSSQDDSSVAYGIGLGYQRGKWSLEAEVTSVTNDLDFIGADLSYRF